MDVFIYIALAGIALFLFELLLPTGGVLAVLGALGLVAAGVVAMANDAAAADYIGPGLITLGVLSAITFYVVTRKVLAAHRDERVHTGYEELVGEEAVVRASVDPVGSAFIEGALWQARLAESAGPAKVGVRVVVEAVDGLTLVVRPVEAPAENPSTEGAG